MQTGGFPVIFAGAMAAAACPLYFACGFLASFILRCAELAFRSAVVHFAVIGVTESLRRAPRVPTFPDLFAGASGGALGCNNLATIVPSVPCDKRWRLGPALLCPLTCQGLSVRRRFLMAVAYLGVTDLLDELLPRDSAVPIALIRKANLVVIIFTAGLQHPNRA